LGGRTGICGLGAAAACQNTVAAIFCAAYASSMSGKAEADKCYLCGAPATTSDHVPPRGVFPSPRPANLITVPACKTCNHGCSLDDEYFRTVVSAVSRDSPRSLHLLKQRILPRVREKPAMGIELLKSVHRVDVFSKGGIFLGRAPQITIDSARIQNVINKIVRGLFWHHTKQRLGSDSIVEDYILNPRIEKPLQDEISKLTLFNVGDGSVFSYCFALDLPPQESFWFLMFYNDTTLFVTRTTRRSEGLA
jgi:hypothetical protein